MLKKFRERLALPYTRYGFMIQPRFWPALAFAVLIVSHTSRAQQQSKSFPSAEKFTYQIDWRLVTAGTAEVQLMPNGNDLWQTKMDLESAGLVSRLYRVLDRYQSVGDSHFCTKTVNLDAEEGKKHNISQLAFDQTQHRLQYDNHDLVKNRTEKKILDIPPCSYDITGALSSLRLRPLEPGKSQSVPISDGKKFAQARIESQARESITVCGKTYHTIRYEAFLFDNVLYRRKGRLQIWFTDDAERLPVQLRLQMGFPIGTVTIQLTDHQYL